VLPPAFFVSWKALRGGSEGLTARLQDGGEGLAVHSRDGNEKLVGCEELARYEVPASSASLGIVVGRHLAKIFQRFSGITIERYGMPWK